VVGEPTVVRAWDGAVHRSSEAFAASDAPLVGFSIIEAPDLDEAVELLSDTPCAVAPGAIEVRPLVASVD
ncbi:MAG: YciI family protein, partial [Actinomycetota bacterium]|nr:YciI family protein [Actinomycetota bacterium]